ncbi:hypothetical protein KP509_1Z003500 [Ceratopteris richardii]|nr:hypothetical protein KP509_1Z003500 [Ceratopteris richardii]KAH6559579.1 hypothetical protein KP509_1Z003500 [Ceratopteris richardii]KAH6559580.1 hypothetical protein KP509_1Z003500 [Ceratopteris richardii]
MPFKYLIKEFQDLRDGLGSISRRSFDIKLPIYHHRSRSINSFLDETQARLAQYVNVSDQSCWANMPPELLRDILRRVESSESTWHSRKHFVACACVCRSWRSIAKELVRPPEHSKKLTFPISVKQPGPRDTPVQCFIKRDSSNSTYFLYLGLTSSLVDNGKFLLAARKVRRATSADYIISLSKDDTSRGSNTYVGKLRSNFLGTKFTIYDSQPPHCGAVASVKKAGRRVGSKQVSPRLPAGSYGIAHIAYELNVLGTRGPRRMNCIMHSIPAAAIEPGGVAPMPVEFSSTSLEHTLSSLPSFGSKSSYSDYSIVDAEGLLKMDMPSDEPLILKNKAPRWHEQLQCWCLNFRGRVTIASVKNFQLVATTTESAPQSSQSDYDKVLLQFGKVAKDVFTMDYKYPLSAFQAFAICLSSFDTKLACE